MIDLQKVGIPKTSAATHKRKSQTGRWPKENSIAHVTRKGDTLGQAQMQLKENEYVKETPLGLSTLGNKQREVSVDNEQMNERDENERGIKKK